MIPKIIHQFNIDNDPNAKVRIDRMRNQNKKWTHKLWKLEDVKNLYPQTGDNFRKKFEYFLENGMLKNAEDIAKFLILKVEGGLFIDDGFELRQKKKLDEIPFGDNDLVLFNGYFSQSKRIRIQEKIIGASPNHNFIIHLLTYIGNDGFLPRCPFDGKVLDIYGAGYITTNYLLYTQLYNNVSRIKYPVASINLIDEKINGQDMKFLEKETIVNPGYVFHINQSMVIRHNIVTKVYAGSPDYYYGRKT